MGPKILLVDDEYDLLNVLQGILEDEGYEVIACGSGKEALARLESERPVLVLLDVMMPAMSGFEVAKRMKASQTLGGIPIVMMSAVDPKQNNGDGPWQAFLRKPFQVKTLLEVVEKFAA